MNKNTRIEIVVTNTVGLNLMTVSAMKTVEASLKEKYKNVVVTLIENEKDLNDLIRRKPDLVFSGVKYLSFDKEGKKRSSKNKIWLSSVLKKHGINHTGSETKALELEFNKINAKKALLKMNILTARYFTAVRGQFKKSSILPIKYPLFIKPIYEGDSRGIDENSVVRNFAEFKLKVKQLQGKGKVKVLVEKYLAGREFTVGIVKNMKTKRLEACPVELIYKKNSKGYQFLSEKDKTDDKELVVSIEDIQLFRKISKFAKQAFRALGARDYGRIDIRMDQQNRLYFLEANLIPGVGHGYFARTMKIVKKQPYSMMINNLALIALKRGR